MKTIMRIPLFLGSILMALNLFGQAPGIEWQQSIGSNNYDFLNAISQTSDGGYIMGGYSVGAISGDKSEGEIGVDDYWIVKLNAIGNIDWENTIGGYNYDKFYSVEETPDGGYIIGGHSLSGGGADKSESNKGGYDYWVVKLNALGIIEWDKTIGGTGNDQLYNAQPTSDGGFILAGTSDSGISGDKTEARVGNSDYWVIKLDASGTIVWQNDIGGVMFENLYSAFETLDGGFILGGTSTSGISGDKTEALIGQVDNWIVKINASGVVEWENTIGGTSYDYLYSVIPTDDGGSIALGLSDSGINGDKTEASNGAYDFWVIKLDNDGNITWQNTIGGAGNDYVFVNPIEQTMDGGYIIGGYSQSGISGDKTEAGLGSWDYWILKLNDTGGIEWQDVIGASGGDYLNAVSETADGGYILGGFSYSGISGDKTEANLGDADYWVIKLEGIGCVPFAEICNGIDDDCDALVDEDITVSCSISATGSTLLCKGESVNLSVTHTGVSLQWKKDGVNILGETSTNYTATTSGNYTCESSSLCGTTLSTGISVMVFNKPKAVVTAGGPISFCAGGSVVLSANPGAGLVYQWYNGPSTIAGATAINYTATTTGNYKCRVTKTATGCFKNSNTIAVTVSCKESALLQNTTISIYPNPANDFIMLYFTLEEFDFNKVNVSITNMIGEEVFAQTYFLYDGILHQKIQLNKNLAAGMYSLKIISEQQIVSENIIIE